MSNCQFCGMRMTSAPSQMDHEAECFKNPKVMVPFLELQLREAKSLLGAVLRGEDVHTSKKWMRRAERLLGDEA